MNDIRIKVGLCDHPKTKRLIRSAGYEAFFGLIRMWLWFRENRPKGNTDGLDNDDIEAIADWRGEAGKFAEGLRSAGFMDTDFLHGWNEHQPWAMNQECRSQKARENVQKRWDKAKAATPSVNNPNTDGIPPSYKPDTPSPSPSPSPSPKKEPKPLASEKAVSLSGLFAQKILARNPAYRMLQPDKRENTLERWSHEFDRTHRIDKRDWDEMERVLCFSQDDDFWWKNILSAEKFREQYDKLLVKMPLENTNGGDNSHTFYDPWAKERAEWAKEDALRR